MNEDILRMLALAVIDLGGDVVFHNDDLNETFDIKVSVHADGIQVRAAHDELEEGN